MSRAFAEDPVKQRQWEALLQDVAVKPAGSLADVLDGLPDFLMLVAAQVRVLSKRDGEG